jgi:hypothetical protein
MTKQQLYYERAVPVSAEKHRDWSLEARTSYAFAAQSSAVPIIIAEFPTAAHDYGIVFTGTGERVHPVVILGLKPDENLFVDEAGNWTGNYIPAFVRRYPFMFAKSPDGSQFFLCIDEAYDGWNQAGKGQPLFDAEGKQTEFLRKMMRFVTEYQGVANATSVFCQQIQDLDLLDPMTARFKLPSGQDAQLSGFRAINRDKLKELSGDKLSELMKSGALDLVYAHLLSLRNIGLMVARVKGEVPAKTDQDDCVI